MKIRKEAKYVHRHHQAERAEPWYRLSVWADVPHEGETREALRRRLIESAGVGGLAVNSERNRVFWWTHPNDLPAPQTGCRGDLEQGAEAMVLHVVEEAPELLGRPDRDGGPVFDLTL